MGSSGFCSCNSALKSGKKVSLCPWTSVCRFSSVETRNIWLMVLSDQSPKVSGAWRLVGGVAGPEGRLMSVGEKERFLSSLVPETGAVPPVEPTPSFANGFSPAGDDGAGVMFIFDRLTAAFSIASLEELPEGPSLGEGGLLSVGVAGGVFVDPSFSRRRRRI